MMNHRTYTSRLTLLLVMLFAFQCGVSAQEKKQTTREAVDLGLSVEWANMNVGAKSSFDYGDYFSWGETKAKRYYGMRFPYAGYNIINGGLYYQKYNSENFKGSTVDNLSELEPEDDAATKNWGAGWRTPTQYEVNELLTQCDWDIVFVDGFHGFKVTSKLNGNFIILPFGGYRNENIRFHGGTQGYYWTRELDSETARNAMVMFIEQGVTAVEFESIGVLTNFRGSQDLMSMDRSQGCTIRPVREN